MLSSTTIQPQFLMKVGASSETIRVPENYPTIQEAIDNANEGDTIYIEAGTYYENVVVNKTLSLVGEDRDTTIIHGNSFGNVVTVTVDNVEIENLNIQHSGYLCVGVFLDNITNSIIQDNCLYDNDEGFRLENCSNISIVNNTVLDQDSLGIVIDSSSDISIIGNIVNNSRGSGIVIFDSDNVLVIGNSANNNHGDGIYLNAPNSSVVGNQANNNYMGIIIHGEPDPASHHNCSVTGNTATNNRYIGIGVAFSSNISVVGNTVTDNGWWWPSAGPQSGIDIHVSRYTSIIGNRISNNSRDGLRIFSSYYNTIYHNAFINNKRQARADTYSNVWDNGHLSGGNYWSDYNGTDSDNDGIGDTPYNIDRIRDSYPLMSPYGQVIDVQHLIREYFPHFIFDEKEKYYPTDFLHDDNDITNNPSNYNESWPLTIYIHTVEFDSTVYLGKEFLAIEYWLYYTRDDGTTLIEIEDDEVVLGQHDHDWESVFVLLEKTNNQYSPAYVAYFHHTNFEFPPLEPSGDSWSLNRWDLFDLPAFDVEDETHPVVHVCRDSHASVEKSYFGYGLSWIKISKKAVYDFHFPVFEHCGGGLKRDYDDFQRIHVNEPDSWLDQIDDIEAPWNRTRWDYLDDILAPYKAIKNSFTMVSLNEPGSKLYLHAYDNQSRHVGFNSATSEMETEIPGSHYEDFGNTTFIILSEFIDLKITVNGQHAHEPEEPYELLISTVSNGEIIDEELITGAMAIGEEKKFAVTLDEEGNIESIEDLELLGDNTLLFIIIGGVTTVIIALVMVALRAGKKRKMKKT